MHFKYYFVYIVHLALVYSNPLSENSTCIGLECQQTISLPLLDRMRATLKADIDVTEINKVLKAYINNEVQVAVENSIKKLTKDITSSNVFKVNESLEAKFKDMCSLNSTCFNDATCRTHQVNGSSFKCICKDGYFGESCQFADSKGMDFILLFTEGYHLQYATPKALITTQQHGDMSAYYFSNNLNQSLNVVKNKNEYSLNHDVYMSDGLKNAGVELHTNVRSMVYGMSYNNYSGDGYSGGYLAIPSDLLSLKYIIPSFTVYSGGLSNTMIAITPTESNTTISLNLKMISGSVTYKNRQYLQNDNLTVVLNKYETFEISHTSDLTGTLISSTSPIAVVSGNKCNYINGKNGCNTFIEMVLPVEQLNKIYIVPHIATRSNSTVRVINVRDGSITVQSNNQVTTKQYRQREFFDFYHDTVAFINATSPVSVMIYPHEIGETKGDAFMMTIHGINQYLPEYDLVVPNGFTSYISVTVETSGLNGFILDGQLVSTDTVYTIYGSYGSYSSFTIQITSGEHNLKHAKDFKFGLWVYGNAFNDAYGYPAGIAFHTT